MTEQADSQLRGLRWVLFFGFVVCFVLMTAVAWSASEDPLLPTMSVAFVVLLVAVTVATAWPNRRAADHPADCLIAFFGGIPRWIGVALALLAVATMGWGVFNYYVREMDFGLVSCFYVVGWGTMALAHLLPRLRRSSSGTGSA